MKIFSTRRTRLRLLIDTQFDRNQTKLAEALKAKAPQINRWLSNKASEGRNITEKSARRIEQAIGLPTGWLDKESEETYSTDRTEARSTLENDEKSYEIPSITSDEHTLLEGYRRADTTRKEDMINLALLALRSAGDQTHEETKVEATPLLEIIRSALGGEEVSKTTK